MNPVKVCFIGCGGIANVHAEHLCCRDDVVMAGCCDINKERAEAFSAKYNMPAYEKTAGLWEKARPHAVYIAVPPDAHGAYEIEAAERGIHLFIEKPIALDLITARNIAAVVRKTKVLVSVGYCFRYSEPAHIAQQMLKGKAVSLVTGMCHGSMPQAPWWRRRACSGGQIVEQTTHIIDLLRYLCGPVSEVHAVAARGCMSQVENYDIDDSTVLTLRLKTGAVASITSTCVLNGPGKTHLEIITPERTLVFTGNAIRVMEDHKSVEHSSTTNMYAAENNAFIKAVQQGRKTGIRSTYSDALKTLRTTLAANESIYTGMPVRL